MKSVEEKKRKPGEDFEEERPNKILFFRVIRYSSDKLDSDDI